MTLRDCSMDIEGVMKAADLLPCGEKVFVEMCCHDKLGDTMMIRILAATADEIEQEIKDQFECYMRIRRAQRNKADLRCWADLQVLAVDQYGRIECELTMYTYVIDSKYSK